MIVLKFFKDFLDKDLSIHIVDALALATFTLLYKLSKLFDFELFSPCFFISFLTIWAVAKILFKVYLIKKENKDKD